MIEVEVDVNISHQTIMDTFGETNQLLKRIAIALEEIVDRLENIDANLDEISVNTECINTVAAKLNPLVVEQ